MARQKPRVGRYLIYGLLDPRDECLFYIGKTHKRRELRLEEHLKSAFEGSECPGHAYIREILRQGFHPVIFVLLRIGPDEDWRDAERETIIYWKGLPTTELPKFCEPKTPKSIGVWVRKVRLQNVIHGSANV